MGFRDDVSPPTLEAPLDHIEGVDVVERNKDIGKILILPQVK